MELDESGKLVEVRQDDADPDLRKFVEQCGNIEFSKKSLELMKQNVDMG
eukprot:CAMPEP_0116985932 /NCGR_PEP_ID=MMETSP0467-20121206/62562_1 /TAXON_ID=283647 /ORGANISM="Mesodinium pulex, Strain SPMC105" /LENGTH=48 /DNA_ID= /DNA_START= /DNA_END= /DNA_ORIENTATION=